MHEVLLFLFFKMPKTLPQFLYPDQKQNPVKIWLPVKLLCQFTAENFPFFFVRNFFIYQNLRYLTRFITQMDLFRDFANLVYPNTCLGCGSVLVLGENHLCTSCLTNLPFAGFEQNPSQHPTAIKFYGKIPPADIFCLLKYKRGNLSQKLIHQFKYNRKKELGLIFSELQVKRFKSNGNTIDWDFIIPIPLHPLKLKTRGFNQSEVYAKHLAEKLNIQLRNDVLIRSKPNKVQALLNRNNRYENVKSIYSSTQKVDIRGKSVLLVDDVITTGATLEVCTHLLLEGGAKKVAIASIATAIYS